MTKKGLEVLKALDHIDNVYCAQDSHVQKDYFNEIRSVCYEKAIPFSYKIDNPVVNDFAIAIGWRWIIKTDKPLYVLHESKLPKYKGWAPLVNQLINGEKEIFVSAFLANDNFDDGEVVCREGIKINYPVKVEKVIDVLCDTYVKLCKKIINKDFGTYEKEPESYSIWLDEQDYEINWNQSSTEIKRFIDSVGFPYGGAKTSLNGNEIRIFDSEVMIDVEIENRKRHVGKSVFIEDGKPVVICGEGLLKLGVKVNKLRNRFGL